MDEIKISQSQNFVVDQNKPFWWAIWSLWEGSEGHILWKWKTRPCTFHQLMVCHSLQEREWFHQTLQELKMLPSVTLYCCRLDLFTWWVTTSLTFSQCSRWLGIIVMRSVKWQVGGGKVTLFKQSATLLSSVSGQNYYYLSAAKSKICLVSYKF